MEERAGHLIRRIYENNRVDYFENIFLKVVLEGTRGTCSLCSARTKGFLFCLYLYKVMFNMWT